MQVPGGGREGVHRWFRGN